MNELIHAFLIPFNAILYCINSFIQMFNRNDIQIFGLPMFNWIFGIIFLSGLIGVIIYVINRNAG